MERVSSGHFIQTVAGAFFFVQNVVFEPVWCGKGFQMKLQEEGYVSTVRKTRGDDVQGACGQLAGVVNNRISKAVSSEKTKIARVL